MSAVRRASAILGQLQQLQPHNASNNDNTTDHPRTRAHEYDSREDSIGPLAPLTASTRHYRLRHGSIPRVSDDGVSVTVTPSIQQGEESPSKQLLLQAYWKKIHNIHEPPPEFVTAGKQREVSLVESAALEALAVAYTGPENPSFISRIARDFPSRFQEILTQRRIQWELKQQSLGISASPSTSSSSASTSSSSSSSDERPRLHTYQQLLEFASESEREHRQAQLSRAEKEKQELQKHTSSQLNSRPSSPASSSKQNDKKSIISDPNADINRFERMNVSERLGIDEDTPDKWIPRNPLLIRLTGVHPLNAEPPLDLLMKSGLITNTRLHYVRNHGYVPALSWNKHRLVVDGLVRSPLSLSMDELISSFSPIQVTATVTCDGNRRKELNLIERTHGFDWGAAATACSRWVGVRLAEILARAKVNKDDAKYVCFEGADMLANGHYGTCIPIEHAMAETRNIIVAYMLNDEWLPPDHGYPIRMLLPGYVGAHSIKWLKRITVSNKPTDNWYYYHDNRLLPSSISSANMVSSGLLYKPETLIYDLNINSAIGSPSHGSFIDASNPNESIDISGFAYTGGGRSVTRVEISVDSGKSWLTATLQFPQQIDPVVIASGNTYTWCHWNIKMPVWRLINAFELAVRAWDSGGNTQPNHRTWNVFGMMNNAIYRVRFNMFNDAHGKLTIACLHPTLAGTQQGGWMNTKASRDIQPDNTTPGPVLNALMSGKIVTKTELSQHNKPDDCWIVINNEVYDVTSYLAEHPGGAVPFLINAGKDVTSAFFQIHANDAIQIAPRFLIGTLIDNRIWQSMGLKLPSSESRMGFLKPRQWICVRLIDRRQISNDTYIFKYELAVDSSTEKNHRNKVQLPAGQHILFGADIEGEWVVRPYTPISPCRDQDDNGIIELLVKVYHPNLHPSFRAGGAMSQYMERMKLNDIIHVKGPSGHLYYHENGRLTVHGYTRQVHDIAGVCGGTGITPFYQLCVSVLNNPCDPTNLSLIYANISIDDILLREELDALAEKHPHRFKLWYTIDKPPRDKEALASWHYDVGFVNEKMMGMHLPQPTNGTVVCICGPPAMVEKAILPSLKNLGFADNTIIEF